MIKINIDKAKTIAHDIRRAAREKEFAPLDTLVMKQIPGVDVALIESERQAIRNKYESIQAKIDGSETPEQIKKALNIN